MGTEALLREGFDKLFSFYGPRYWWPAETPFEVMVGAILTQNTNWKNVESAINNLKNEGVLEPRKLYALSDARLSSLIRPAGYYRLKSSRLKHFLQFFIDEYDGDVQLMSEHSINDLREGLLSVNGIGRETADSILLYALDKPIFVVDSYTKRILMRHNVCDEETDYDGLQELFMSAFPSDEKLFNEYHALIVETGKNFCKKKPLCESCPLSGWNDLPFPS